MSQDSLSREVLGLSAMAVAEGEESDGYGETAPCFSERAFSSPTVSRQLSLDRIEV